MALITVEWSDKADRSLEGIFDYYSRKAGLKIAQKIVNKIYSRTAILVNHPLAGARERLLDGMGVEFRYLVEGNYKIVYWLEPGMAYIFIVFDSRRDPRELKWEVRG